MPEFHLARYVVDVVDSLSLTEIERDYTGRGSKVYFSQHNVALCEQAGVIPLIAAGGREAHHLTWQKRFIEPAPLSADAISVEKMKHALKKPAGRADHALRKQMVEPVFGIIKSVMGFCQFLLSEMDKVQSE